jgi:hypothetical protein
VSTREFVAIARSPTAVVVGERVQETRLLPAAERCRSHNAAFTRHCAQQTKRKKKNDFFLFCFVFFFSEENLNADVRGCDHRMVRVVQAACWCAALIIAATTLAVLMFEFADPLTGPHPHALPQSLALDTMFDDHNAKLNVYGVVGAASDADLNVLAKACVASSSFWKSQEASFAALQGSLMAMCKTVPRLVELSLSAGPDDLAALPLDRVRKVIRLALESGYGENPTASIRNIVAAALDGHDAFERHELVDLGCGRGKVLAVACTQLDRTGDRFVFEHCHGVEHADVAR